MTLRTIMVHVGPAAFDTGRVDAAISLAQRFGARLIGAGATALPQMIVTPEGVMSPAPDNVKMLEDDLVALSKRFKEHAAILGAGNVSWRGEMGPPAEHVARHARAADLVVVGSRVEREDTLARLDPSDVLMAAGRPVLAMPAGQGDVDMTTAVIAWKDAPQARRAVAAALPVLLRVRQAVIIGVGEESREDGLKDVSAWLTDHGVNCQTRAIQGRDAGPSLRSAAKDLDAGLIVAGAYGRSRLREFILGGVTRDLLFNSPVPCLFAH